MSFQCDGKTTVYTSGCWQKIEGKMEFVETTFERPTDFDCLFEPQSLDQVSLDIYEDRSSSSFYSSHSSVSKSEVCNIVEQ